MAYVCPLLGGEWSIAFAHCVDLPTPPALNPTLRRTCGSAEHDSSRDIIPAVREMSSSAKRPTPPASRRIEPREFAPLVHVALVFLIDVDADLGQIGRASCRERGESGGGW